MDATSGLSVSRPVTGGFACEDRTSLSIRLAAVRRRLCKRPTANIHTSITFAGCDPASAGHTDRHSATNDAGRGADGAAPVRTSGK